MRKKWSYLSLPLLLVAVFVQAQVNDSTVNIDNNFRNTLYTSQFGVGKLVAMLK